MRNVRSAELSKYQNNKKINNIMEQKIKAYKAFDKDLSCRGFKYEVGKEYEETGDIKACEKGFHACPYPLDVFGYYAPAWSRFCEVEQSGQIDDSEGDKVCSSKIRIGAELDIRGLVKAAVSFVKERCTNECNVEPGKPATAVIEVLPRLVIEVLPRLVIEVLPRLVIMVLPRLVIMVLPRLVIVVLPRLVIMVLPRLVIEVLPRLVIMVLPRQEERFQPDQMVCQWQEVTMFR